MLQLEYLYFRIELLSVTLNVDAGVESKTYGVTE